MDIAFLCGMIVLLILAAVSARKMHKIHFTDSFLTSVFSLDYVVVVQVLLIGSVIEYLFV